MMSTEEIRELASERIREAQRAGERGNLDESYRLELLSTVWQATAEVCERLDEITGALDARD